MKSIIRHKDVREFEIERCALPGVLSWLDSEDRKMSGEELWELLNAWLAVRNDATNAVFFITGVVLGRHANLKKEWMQEGLDLSWTKAMFIMRVIQSLLDVEGKCKILSEGDGCNCALCQIGRLDPKKVLAAANAAGDIPLAGLTCYFMALKGRAVEFKKEQDNTVSCQSCGGETTIQSAHPALSASRVPTCGICADSGIQPGGLPCKHDYHPQSPAPVEAMQKEPGKLCKDFSAKGDKRCVFEVDGDFNCGDKPCIVKDGRRFHAGQAEK